MLLVTGAKIPLYSGASEWLELSFDPYRHEQAFDAHTPIRHTAGGRDIDGLYALSDGPGGSIRIEFDTVPSGDPADDEGTLVYHPESHLRSPEVRSALRSQAVDYRMVITSGEGESKGRTSSSFPKACRPSTPKADE